MALADKADRAERADDGASVGDDAYRRIRNDIVFARLRPAQRLRLESLKVEYGVSVTTLREILSRLSSEGLVVAEGRRGFEVAPVSIGDLKDLAALRLLLEGHAMAQSFANGDMEWEGRVVSAHHKLAATEQLMLAPEPPLTLWKKYDGEFHQALISNCGSPALMAVHAGIFDRYFRYQMLMFEFRGEEPTRQHRVLLDCALTRDAVRAQAELATHLENCVADTIARGAIR